MPVDYVTGEPQVCGAAATAMPSRAYGGHNQCGRVP